MTAPKRLPVWMHWPQRHHHVFESCFGVFCALPIRASLPHCCTTNRWPLPYCWELKPGLGPFPLSAKKTLQHYCTIILTCSIPSIIHKTALSTVKRTVYSAIIFTSRHCVRADFGASFSAKPFLSNLSGKLWSWNRIEGFLKGLYSSLWSDKNIWVKPWHICLALRSGGIDRIKGQRKENVWYDLNVDTSLLNMTLKVHATECFANRANWTRWAPISHMICAG